MPTPWATIEQRFEKGRKKQRNTERRKEQGNQQGIQLLSIRHLSGSLCFSAPSDWMWNNKWGDCWSQSWCQTVTLLFLSLLSRPSVPSSCSPRAITLTFLSKTKVSTLQRQTATWTVPVPIQGNENKEINNRRELHLRSLKRSNAAQEQEKTR